MNNVYIYLHQHIVCFMGHNMTIRHQTTKNTTTPNPQKTSLRRGGETQKAPLSITKTVT